jgi:hypothetical protein
VGAGTGRELGRIDLEPADQGVGAAPGAGLGAAVGWGVRHCLVVHVGQCRGKGCWRPRWDLVRATDLVPLPRFLALVMRSFSISAGAGGGTSPEFPDNFRLSSGGIPAKQHVRKPMITDHWLAPQLPCIIVRMTERNLSGSCPELIPGTSHIEQPLTSGAGT